MAIQRAGDAMGISLSGLCMIHCLALPLLVSLFPLAGAWAEAPWVHWLFVILAGPLAAYVLSRPDAAGRRDWPLIAIGAIGVELLFLAAAEFPTHETETLMTVTGGLVLAGAHILNWRKRSHVH
jgi:hypothetical protein